MPLPDSLAETLFASSVTDNDYNLLSVSDSTCTFRNLLLTSVWQYILKVMVMVAESHTIAENLILPATIDMVRELLDQSAANTLKTILLLNDTISRWIEETFNDIK